MRTIVSSVVCVCLLGATACATGVAGDSLGEAPPATGTKDDVDAGYSNPWQPVDAGQGADTTAPPPNDAATQGGEDSGGGGQADAGDDAGFDSGSTPADAATGADSGGTTGLVCGGYAPPNTQASCDASCTVHNCNANGCYGTYWCDTSSNACVPPVSGCDAGL